MKIIVLLCPECHKTANVSAILAGYESLLLRGVCPSCKLPISCFINHEKFRERTGHESGEHVLLSSVVDRPLVAHA